MDQGSVSSNAVDVRLHCGEEGGCAKVKLQWNISVGVDSVVKSAARVTPISYGGHDFFTA